MATTATKIKCKFRKGDVPWHLVLKNVQARLMNEHGEYFPRWSEGLCFDIAAALHHINDEQAERMGFWIMSHFGDRVSAEGWLRDQGVKTGRRHTRAMHEWRIDWLTILINEAEPQWRKYVAKETR